MNDTEEIVPLKVLPNAGLIAYPYDMEEREDNSIAADNVLTGALGRLKKVSLVGIDEDGEYYFASSITSIDEVQRNIREFHKFLDMYESD